MGLLSYFFFLFLFRLGFKQRGETSKQAECRRRNCDLSVFRKVKELFMRSPSLILTQDFFFYIVLFLEVGGCGGGGGGESIHRLITCNSQLYFLGLQEKTAPAHSQGGGDSWAQCHNNKKQQQKHQQQKHTTKYEWHQMVSCKERFK